MIRVLHVLRHLQHGGPEMTMMQYYRAINREKIQFDFLISERTKDVEIEKEIARLGGRVFLAHPEAEENDIELADLDPSLGMALFPDRMDHFLKELLSDHPEINIVHCHLRGGAKSIINTAHRAGRRVIEHAHFAAPGESLSGYDKLVQKLKQRTAKAQSRDADRKLAPSKVAGDAQFGKGMYAVLPAAFDVPRFRYKAAARKAKRKELGFADKDFVVGAIGRITKAKNPLFILDIFRWYLNSQNPNAKFVWIGEGDMQTEIDRKIDIYGLKNDVVRFSARADIPDLMMAMDLFLLPSLWEGLGLVAVEAQAAGLPCLLSDGVPKEAQLLPERVSVLKLTTPAKEWAKVLYDMYEPTPKERMAANAVVAATEYDIKKSIEKLEALYISL